MNAYTANGGCPSHHRARRALWTGHTDLQRPSVELRRLDRFGDTPGPAFGFSGTASYTWSHALDETTGLFNTPVALSATVPYQLDPNNLRLNYGNSDLDIGGSSSPAHSSGKNHSNSRVTGLKRRRVDGRSRAPSLLGVDYLTPSSTVVRRSRTFRPGLGGLPPNWGVYGALLNPSQAFPGCSGPGNIAAGDAHQCLTSSMFIPPPVPRQLSAQAETYSADQATSIWTRAL